jgi:hypothetical protein
LEALASRSPSPCRKRDVGHPTKRQHAHRRQLPKDPACVLYVRFLRSRAAFADLERWQTTYLPVYAAWAALVVIVFPRLFAYV